MNCFVGELHVIYPQLVDTRGVTVHQNGGSVRTSVFKSRFGMFLVQQ